VPRAVPGLGQVIFSFDRRLQRHTDGKHRAITVFHLRQSEIEDLGVAPFGDENVRRLDVAMHNAFGVGGVEYLGNINSKG